MTSPTGKPHEEPGSSVGLHRRAVRVGDRQREYLVHVPERSAQQTDEVPVVLAFHGSGTNAAGMQEFSGLSEKANAAGFVVVFPEGTGRVPQARTFNAGGCCGHAHRHDIDDVAYVHELLDDLGRWLPRSHRRVYATGMSNGAMMAYRLACVMPERIAAIAPVAGPMGLESCHPSSPVPICHFHGRDDEFAPFLGGRGSRSRTQTIFRSVPASLKLWRAVNRCRDEPEVIEHPPLVDDGTRVTQHRFLPEDPTGAEIRLYEIHGGGHTWPGRSTRYDFLGPSTRNISANDVMWTFFHEHDT